jgi:benzil reductase ((S)-benzoin forming)
MHHYIITGTSRGIGKAMAEALLEDPANHVTGLSRTCSITHERYAHVQIDLANEKEVRAFEFPAFENAASLTLVNNAGVVGAIRYMGKMDDDAIIRAYHVNLVAPTLLVNSFLARYSSREIRQLIINISSGAGKNPIDGWSVYCATKAGLDHFSRTVAEELRLSGKTNVRVMSVAPGIVDTAMQDEIRSASVDNFSRLEQFTDYKNTSQLASPRLTALKYLSIFRSPENHADVVFSAREIPPISQ